MQVELDPKEITYFTIRIDTSDLHKALREIGAHRRKMQNAGFECSSVMTSPYWSAYAGHLSFAARIMKGREDEHMDWLVEWDRKFEPHGRLIKETKDENTEER